jgi:hypothetical protein
MPAPMRNDPQVSGGHQPGNENSKEQFSDEFLGLKDFFGVVAQIAAALAGATAIYFVIGYVIILSFINKFRLYGLANFPKEFYSEATVTFITDLFETYGRHPYCATFMIIATATVLYLFMKCSRCAADSWKGKVLRGAVTGVFAGAIVASIALDRLDAWLEWTDFKKLFLFMIAVPLLVGLFMYLAIRFKRFALKPYRYYYAAVVLFVCLLVAIPIGYGDNIYDITLYPIVAFDCAEDLKLPALAELKEQMSKQGEGTLFFLMGHTTEREVFFDNQDLTSQPRMILVERSLIKYLKLSGDINSVRKLLHMEHKGSVPVGKTQAEVDVRESPAEIQKILDKVKL